MENTDKFLECTCGYAYYKILGVTPGASSEEVAQTYQYLKKVWDKNTRSRDPSLKKKAEERIKKIEEAHSIYKHFITGIPEAGKKQPYTKIAYLAGIAVIVLAGILIFLYLSQKETSLKRYDRVQISGQAGEQYMAEGTQYPEEEYNVEEIQPFDRNTRDIATMTGEEKAIEFVKRSQGIDSFYSDESRIADWEAKGIDDQRYLVSFTASRGSDTSAYYFEANIRTGTVRPVTDRLELQGYGIQQSNPARYRLDVTVPEHVRENTTFEAQVIITGKPNIKLPVSQQMFFIVSNGCDVTAISGKAPGRMSDILPEYGTVKATKRDPYIPSEEFIALDSMGKVMIPVTLKAGKYSDSLPRVGAGPEKRGCILEVSIGSSAKVETWVVVEAE